jgi:hypothetical protein
MEKLQGRTYLQIEANMRRRKGRHMLSLFYLVEINPQAEKTSAKGGAIFPVFFEKKRKILLLKQILRQVFSHNRDPSSHTKGL